MSTAGDTLSFLRKHEPTTREVQLELGYIVTDADTKLGCPPARCLRSYEDEDGLVDAVYEFTDGSRLRFQRGEGYGYHSNHQRGLS